MLQLKNGFMKEYRTEEFIILTILHNIKIYQLVDIFLSNKNVINYNPDKQPQLPFLPSEIHLQLITTLILIQVNFQTIYFKNDLEEISGIHSF